MPGGARERCFFPRWEKGGPGGGPPKFKWGVLLPLFGPPPGFFSFFFFSRLGCFGGIWGGDKHFPPRKPVWPMIFPQGPNLPPIKGKKRGVLPRGGGPFEIRGPPGFGTWAFTPRGPGTLVILLWGGRFFFFFFFFFFFS
eukprot:FR743190.1.p2 GENE.FR743190.1~~FR743190.1.p2  ORF type:complete len:140 (-),score=100.58 FR743190.1:695-1114(-)